MLTTEDMINEILDFTYDAYRKASRGCPEADKLSRKVPVIIDGYEFSCWREYTTYKTAQYLHEKSPDTDIEVELDGNDSIIHITLDGNQQRDLDKILYSFLQENNLI